METLSRLRRTKRPTAARAGARAVPPAQVLPDVPATVDAAPISRQTCPSLDNLHLLRPVEVNLISLERALPRWLSAPLATWARGAPPKFDRILRAPRYDVDRAIRGLPDAARCWLADDIATLLDRFARFTKASRLRVSFGAVSSDQCKKFHMDYVNYRLVTTYTGPGTEWVPEHAVCRQALKRPADCPSEANRAIVRHVSAIRRAGPGDVLVMKGTLHPHGLGAVHRSPPVEATGQLRVVLTASTVESP